MITRGRISNLNGELPTMYDPSWASFTDLSPAQIAAFQAFPEDLIKYIGIMRWQAEICAFPQLWNKPGYITLPSGIQLKTDERSQQRIAGLKQAIDNGTIKIVGSTFPFSAVNGICLLSSDDITTLYGYVVRYVEATYTVASRLTSQVNAVPQQIKSRSPIDSAFSSIPVQ